MSKSYSGHSHSFDTGIAFDLGVNAAIIFNHIVYWLRINASKANVEFIDGKIWMFEKQGDMANFLSYLSLEEVKKACVKLVDAGLLIKANHNKNLFDKTNWYTTYDQFIIWKGIRNSKNPYESAAGRDRESPAAPSTAPQGAMYNTVQEEHTSKTTTTTTSECVVPLDQEKKDKLKELGKVKISNGLIESSMRYSLDDIKLAIECCLNPSSAIDDMDAYFWSALTKKWKPKPSKEKIAKSNEEAQQKQQQTRQKIYAEAKNLEITHKYSLKEGCTFSVNENSITLKINSGFTPFPLEDESIKTLRKYIKDNKK